MPKGIFHTAYFTRNGKFLRSSLNTYITSQPFRTILLLKSSDVSFFTNSICAFAMLSIIVLNFPTSNVQTNRSKNILQKFGKKLHSFALIFLILVIWQFNTFRIPAFLSAILAMVVALFFILFIELIFNIYIKLTCIIEIFINFLIIFLSFFCVLLLGYFLFSRLADFFLWPLYCFCVILLIFYTFLVCFLPTLKIIIYH